MHMSRVEIDRQLTSKAIERLPTQRLQRSHTSEGTVRPEGDGAHLFRVNAAFFSEKFIYSLPFVCFQYISHAGGVTALQNKSFVYVQTSAPSSHRLVVESFLTAADVCI